MGTSNVEVPADRLQDQIGGRLLGHIIGDLNGLKYKMKYIAGPRDVEHSVPELPGGRCDRIICCPQMSQEQT